MAAWDSVTGHHLGLTHALQTFTKTVKKRVDEPGFDVYRHGIMHGAIVNFDNVVVATKAWNLLFAVADWVDATMKAAAPMEPKPSLKETWSSMPGLAAYKQYEKAFVRSTIDADESHFAQDDVVHVATSFREAWKHGRWGHVAAFIPPIVSVEPASERPALSPQEPMATAHARRTARSSSKWPDPPHGRITAWR